MRRQALVPAVVAALVFVFGVMATWVGPDSDWPERCPAGLFEEGSVGADVKPSILPPGTHCSGVTPDGRFVESVYVPWLEWLIAVGLAALAACVAAVVGRVLRRRRHAPLPPH